MYHEINFLEPGRDLKILTPIFSNSKNDKILGKIGFTLESSGDRDFGLSTDTLVTELPG